MRQNIKKAFVRTYGCQQNVSDSEKINGILENMGYELTDDRANADLILFNTCAVRENAENRVFGNIGQLKVLKKENPNLKIVICGCMTEQSHIAEKIKKTFPFVDLVFGTNLIHKLPEMLLNSNFKPDDVGKEIPENLPIKRDSKIKAFLPIMKGCDNFCSYCIVPYVRGREQSREPESIISEFESLVKNGYKEITLLGQNVNSYGKNLKEKINFPELLCQLCEIPGDFQVKFMTSHPKDATRELIDVIAKNPKICRNIHLPVQCGSNRILSLMNRNYTKEQYLEIINYARDKIPGSTFSSDIIVGFPGETYEEFKETLKLIKEVKFSMLFTFIYSKRQGTPAAEMDDFSNQEEKTKWLMELLEVQKEIEERHKI